MPYIKVYNIVFTQNPWCENDSLIIKLHSKRFFLLLSLLLSNCVLPPLQQPAAGAIGPNLAVYRALPLLGPCHFTLSVANLDWFSLPTFSKPSPLVSGVRDREVQTGVGETGGFQTPLLFYLTSKEHEEEKGEICWNPSLRSPFDRPSPKCAVPLPHTHFPPVLIKFICWDFQAL